MSPNRHRGWVVTFAGMGINLCLGVLYSWSVFAKALVNQFGWTKTASSWPYTVAIIVFALVMVPAGRLTDKWGPRRVATLGGVFAGTGMVLAGFTQNLGILVISFGILLGTGMGLGYAAPTPAAVKWFGPHKRGLIAGLVVAGFGLASVYIAPLTNYLINAYGLERAFWVEGLIFLVAIILLARFVIFPPKDYEAAQLPAAGKQKAAADKREYDWQEMLKTPVFYLIWITYVLGAAAGLMIIGHLAKIAEIQAGIAYGFIFVATLAVFNAGGRVVSGWLGDVIGRTNTLFLVLVVQALNMFVFQHYIWSTTLFVGVIVAGYCYGSLLALFPSITYEYFGTKNAGINYGIVFTAWGVGGVVGPIIAGKVADITGAYGHAYFIAATLCAAGAILTRLMRAPKAAPAVKTSAVPAK